LSSIRKIDQMRKTDVSLQNTLLTLEKTILDS